jgi:hypothetical protein
MKRFTEKTIRTAGQWCKISRDNQDRTFTFARGYDGQYQAHEIETYSFKWVANWAEATQKANLHMSVFA